MDPQQQSRWRPTRGQILWTVAALALLGIAILIGYRYGITLWDWIKLLVVPVVIAGGGIWFNRQQRERELKIGDQRAEEDRRIAQERTETDREIADQRAQDEALQAYLDQLGQLLLDKVIPLRQSNEGDEVRTLARARTLTVLNRLDPERKAIVLQFLYEAGLIAEDHPVLDLNDAALFSVRLDHATLEGANLSRAQLGKANLFGANLSETNLAWANLSEANLHTGVLQGTNLEGALLEGADLFGTNLQGANLVWSTLRRANLFGANLYDANLNYANLSEADLGGADLRGANLSEADLQGANLYDAKLRGANLFGARGWTLEQLTEARALKEATMPNGQKYEDWLKDREGRKEDAEND